MWPSSKVSTEVNVTGSSILMTVVLFVVISGVLQEFSTQYVLWRRKHGRPEIPESVLDVSQRTAIAAVGSMCAKTRYYAVNGRRDGKPAYAHYAYGQRNQFDFVLFNDEEEFQDDAFLQAFSDINELFPPFVRRLRTARVPG